MSTDNGLVTSEGGIELVMQKGVVIPMKEFRKYPPYSVGIDGIVRAESVIDPTGPRANFDHHYEANGPSKQRTRTDISLFRDVTNSSAEQVRMAINRGLFKIFREDGIPRAIVYANDCDEDVCLTWWLLKHHELVDDHGMSPINRLVYFNNLLDMSAGGYNFGDTEMYRRTLWVFAPYKYPKMNLELRNMDGLGYRNVIESVCQRINEHVHNGGGEYAIGKEVFEVLHTGNGWSMVKEHGLADRMLMGKAGITSFVSYLGEQEDGHVYTIAHMDLAPTFHNPALFEYLNGIEKDRVTATNRWGGTVPVGGSPRLTGSGLAPDDLVHALDNAPTKVLGHHLRP